MISTVPIAAVTAVAIVAATESPSLSPTYLLQFGVLGLLVVAMVWRRWIVPGWALEESEKECERLRTELAALRMAYEEKAERTMAALTNAVQELTRVSQPRGPQ